MRETRKALMAAALSAALAPRAWSLDAAAPLPGAARPVVLDLQSPNPRQAPNPWVSWIEQSPLGSVLGPIAGALLSTARLAPSSQPIPELPRSALVQPQAAAESVPLSEGVGGLGQQAAPRPGGSSQNPVAPIAPGGIAPLRASGFSQSAGVYRRARTFAAKARALKDPLKSVADLPSSGMDSQTEERASAAGRAISDIVTDQWALTRSARDEPLRDALADGGGGAPLPSAAASAFYSRIAAAQAPCAAPRPGQAAPRPGSAAGAAPLDEALDAAQAANFYLERAAPVGLQAAAEQSRKSPMSAYPSTPDLARLLLKVKEQTLRISRVVYGLAPRAQTLDFAGAQSVARRSSTALGWSGAKTPAPRRAGESSAAGGASTKPMAAFYRDVPLDGAQADSPSDPAPMRVDLPPALLFSLLLPLLAVAVYYSSEF